MSLLRYITHPNVAINPEVPVPNWGLSDEGRQRLEAMLGQPWTNRVERVLASPETKARETADVLARHCGLTVELRESTGETDRSATGFVTHDRHEELADRFFAKPFESADGWERAVDVQQRVVTALTDLLVESREQEGDVAVIGHGAVGTLLYCHLAGLDIDRSHDQPGQGHYWTFDRTTGLMHHPWQPIERLEGFAAAPARHG